MDIEDEARNYLETFANRDIEALAGFFSESVVLRDWEVSVTGKEKVIEANKGIFDSFTSIDLDITNVVSSKNQVVVEFALNLHSVDELISLLVTDIIEYDAHGKIISVRAYKGN